MMAKRKQPKELKIKLIFHPVTDWDVRLKRVMELLLKQQSKESNGRKKGV